MNLTTKQIIQNIEQPRTTTTLELHDNDDDGSIFMIFEVTDKVNNITANIQLLSSGASFLHDYDVVLEVFEGDDSYDASYEQFKTRYDFDEETDSDSEVEYYFNEYLIALRNKMRTHLIFLAQLENEE